MTLREALENARERAYDGSSKMLIRGAIEEAIRIFDASREITDKETLPGTVPSGTGYGRFFQVVNHKARVVWDD